MTRLPVLLGLFLGLLFATSAHAVSGTTTANVNMRTGPGVGHTRITVIPKRRAVVVEHCTQTLRWCLVRWRGNRGWVSARYLRFDRPRVRTVLPPPYLLFDFQYRDRTWRKRHDRWHRGRPYPKKKVRRPKWNRDHDRWHKKQAPRRRLVRPGERRPGNPGRRICPPSDRRCR